MHHETLTYQADGLTMHSQLFFEPAAGPRGGVLVFPEAFGLGEHAISRAERLAALGYVALACDLRVAASNARLGAPPAKLGLMYSLADTRRLMHAVGASAAKNILFTGEFHDADKALAIGLVDEVHDPVGLIAAVSAKARLMASLSPWSIRRAKAVVRLIQGGATEETDETRGWFADAASSPDLAQGLVAFAEKREPKF